MNAFDTITRECFRSFAVLPNAELIDEDDLFGVMTDIPLSFVNGVATSHLDAEGIASTVARFRARNAPFRWWVTPWSEPADLEDILLAHGLKHAYDSAGMTADLATLPESVSVPDVVAFARVENEMMLTAWAHILLTVFNRPLSDAEGWLRTFVPLGFDVDAPWAHFLAFVDGSPAATSSVLLTGDLAGVYFVGTLPWARGKGIGAAVTHASLRFAMQRGAKEAVLQSSEMAVNVYRSLGFVERCTLRLLDWHPES